MQTVKTTSMALGDAEISFETGRFALQADAAVLVSQGEQSILLTATMGGAREGMDFFPLVVEFEPRYYAAGRIKHSKVNKREGRKSDQDILTCRVTDRPLRPMFPKGMRNEVQIIATQFQTDSQRISAPLCITAASMAIQLSGIPFERSVSAVQVGMDEDGNFITSPTHEQVEATGLDFVVAGTSDAIMMVEAGANLIDNQKALAALEYAHEEIKKLCALQDEFVSQFDIETKEVVVASDSDTFLAATAAVKEVLSEAELDGIAGVTKKEVKKKMHVLEEKLFEACATRIEAEEFSKKDLVTAFEKAFAKSMRKRIFETGKRVDGRDMDTVRPLIVDVGLFPRVHGSGLFQRGETQVLSMLSLGGPDSEEYADTTDKGEFRRRYLHHYNFPPYSVGETRMLRGPGRREIGHGALAERALSYVLPKIEDGWAYTIRVVSEVLACNGSSSMASVCGSTLALMDAGVPIKTPIAGIAMGLMMDEETGDYKILTDIQGLEDFDGDMDFKVAGDETGLTCIQLDIKIKGLDLSLLTEALEKAQNARAHILAAMKAQISAPREKMNQYAPLIETMKVKEEQIRDIIGKGGSVIQGMCADYDVNISVEDDGTVVITGLQAGIDQAREQIEMITYEPKIGDVFENAEVKTITDFGAFVQFLPGRDALLHISEIADERVNKVEDYLTLGQKITVKITEKDRMGRLKLTMKGLN